MQFFRKSIMKEIMETVFITDDEANFREDSKCISDCEALGFAVCDEASNGEDALREKKFKKYVGESPAEYRKKLDIQE